MKKYLILLAKVGVSAGLVWFAFKSVDLESAWAAAQSMAIGAILAALGLLAVLLVLSALRLSELLALLRSPIRLATSLDVMMIGAFFSQTFASFMGGDVMRVWRLSRAGVSLSEAGKAVLFDRIAGFAGLIAIVLASMPLLFPAIENTEMRLGLVLIALAVLGGLGGLFLLRRLPRSFGRIRFVRLLWDVASDGLMIFRSSRGTVIVFGLSVGIQLLNVLVIFALARGLAIPMRLGECFQFVPIVLFLSMLPISVAGWGVREGAMVTTLAVLGIPSYQSLALSISFGLCQIAVSLPGGLVWLSVKRDRQAANLLSLNQDVRSGSAQRS